MSYANFPNVATVVTPKHSKRRMSHFLSSYFGGPRKSLHFILEGDTSPNPASISSKKWICPNVSLLTITFKWLKKKEVVSSAVNQKTEIWERDG